MTPDPMMIFAQKLTQRRFAVFPLVPGQKIPHKDSHGLRDATSDPAIVRRMWDKHPGSNIGVATGPASGIWVLDVDPQGHEVLAQLEAQHGKLPLTIEATTPRQGRHLYWRLADGLELRNSAGRVGAGLDVRADGGQIVAPPSSIPGTPGYQWAKNGAKTFAVAPAWLIELASPPPEPPRPVYTGPKLDPAADRDRIETYFARAIASELQKVAIAAEGTRNATLNVAAYSIGQIVAGGFFPEANAVEELTRAAQSVGLPMNEITRTIASGLKAGAQHPRELPHDR